MWLVCSKDSGPRLGIGAGAFVEPEIKDREITASRGRAEALGEECGRRHKRLWCAFKHLADKVDVAFLAGDADRGAPQRVVRGDRGMGSEKEMDEVVVVVGDGTAVEDEIVGYCGTEVPVLGDE